MKILRRIIAFKLTDAEHIKHCKLFDFLLFVRTYAWMIMRRIPWWCVLHECVASWCIFFPGIYMGVEWSHRRENSICSAAAARNKRKRVKMTRFSLTDCLFFVLVSIIRFYWIILTRAFIPFSGFWIESKSVSSVKHWNGGFCEIPYL